MTLRQIEFVWMVGLCVIGVVAWRLLRSEVRRS